MLQYAGQAHAQILDALDTYVSDEQWDAIQADTFPADALRAEMARTAAERPAPTARASYFPGWHGITEIA